MKKYILYSIGILSFGFIGYQYSKENTIGSSEGKQNVVIEDRVVSFQTFAISTTNDSTANKLSQSNVIHQPTYNIEENDVIKSSVESGLVNHIMLNHFIEEGEIEDKYSGIELDISLKEEFQRLNKKIPNYQVELYIDVDLTDHYGNLVSFFNCSVLRDENILSLESHQFEISKIGYSTESLSDYIYYDKFHYQYFNDNYYAYVHLTQVDLGNKYDYDMNYSLVNTTTNEKNLGYLFNNEGGVVYLKQKKRGY